MITEKLRSYPCEESFPVGRFLGSDGIRELQKLRCGQWPEQAEFVNTSFARDQFRKMIARMAQAIDQGLFNDPVNVGAAAGALEILASSLCRDPESADYIVSCWRDYDCSELFEFLTSPGRDEGHEASEIPAIDRKRKAAGKRAKGRASGQGPAS